MALVHVAFVGSLALYLAIPFFHGEPDTTDFSTFYSSAEAVRDGGDPYVGRHPRVEGDAVRLGNLNPPFQTVLMAPLALLPRDVAEWTWYGLGLVALLAAGFLTARTFVPGHPLAVWGPAACVALILFFPTLANAWLAQFGVVLALVAALSWRLALDRRDLALGALLGLTAGLKIFVGLFGIFFLLTRRWRSLVAFSGGFAVSVLVGGIVLGWSVYPAYFEVLEMVSWHAASWNPSIFGVVGRLLGSGVHTGLLLHRPEWAMGVSRAVAVAAGIAYCVVLLRAYPLRSDPARAPAGTPEGLGLGIGFTLTMMLLLSPLGWVYYFPALLPACAGLVAVARPGRERRVAATAAAAFILLSDVPHTLRAVSEIGGAGYPAWRVEAPALALVILAGAHAWLLLKRRVTAPRIPPAEAVRSAAA